MARDRPPPNRTLRNDLSDRPVWASTATDEDCASLDRTAGVAGQETGHQPPQGTAIPDRQLQNELALAFTLCPRQMAVTPPAGPSWVRADGLGRVFGSTRG